MLHEHKNVTNLLLDGLKHKFLEYFHEVRRDRWFIVGTEVIEIGEKQHKAIFACCMSVRFHIRT